MEDIGVYLKDYFANDYRLNILSDGKLETEDGSVFHIHKYELAKNNKYFYALFCGMGKDKNDFLIPGVKGEVLSNILSYIYSGNIYITNQNMSELMIASDYLMVDGCLSELKIFVKNNLSISNCVPVYVAALMINRKDFAKESYRILQTNFEKVVLNRGTEIANLPLGAFEQLLSDRNLCISSEKTVFISIVKWISFDNSKRLSFVPNLIKYLMLSDIDEGLATEILEHDIVAKNTVFQHTDIKSFFPSNLEAIKIYMQSSQKPESLPFKRIPPKLNCIARYYSCNGNDCIQIYLTYDEQIDLWRKILNTYLSPQFFVYIDDSIYMLRTNQSRNFRYSIVDKQWYELDDFIHARKYYAVVRLEGSIYVLGGTSTITENEIYSVEVYDSDFHVWYESIPMIPVSAFAAEPLNNHIYVVGYQSTFEGYEMITQVFDASTEAWTLLPSVPTERSHFALVAFMEKIYVIGGMDSDEYLKVVEVFDPAENEWRTETSLPYIYYFPKAIVFQDLLIVYDDHLEDREYLQSHPPVFWNNQEGRWECFEESSPFKNLHLFQFFTIGNQEYIDIISRENRHPDTQFEKSPFV